jgi:hypothetical protein
MTTPHLAHGRTMRSLDQLTRVAIRITSAYSAIDTDERYAAGWHAAVELLLTTDDPPTASDIITAARWAADTHTRRTAENRGHGRPRGDGSRSDGAAPRYWAYWDTSTRVTPSPETGITDRIALTQIWPHLTPAQQQALTALAALGDYQRAADALGLSYHTYCRRLSAGRARFLALWLEGETPAGRWRDRRVQTEGGTRQSMSASIRRRARAGATA